MPTAKIGVIGGSGLYQMAGLTDVEEVHAIDSVWRPSDAFFVGTLAGESCVSAAARARTYASAD